MTSLTTIIAIQSIRRIYSLFIFVIDFQFLTLLFYVSIISFLLSFYVCVWGVGGGGTFVLYLIANILSLPAVYHSLLFFFTILLIISCHSCKVCFVPVNKFFINLNFIHPSFYLFSFYFLSMSITFSIFLSLLSFYPYFNCSFCR